ncbi:ADAMTS-like protein 2 isoform X2 [Scleropages formosus]|uniref:ADAMTS-like protein 2 isoform X2 n=1 Tax=Scleropages formosus TaxID=113540 RepID=UPI0008788769|nr:ADAMTS-like protein 2 isoform X2 [Scleropages formosus]
MHCLSTSGSCAAALIRASLLLLGIGEASSASFKDSSEEPPGQSEEVAQWWGEWSSWSTCSRTCGGGVRSQERHCLQQRLTAVPNVSISICVGAAKKYQLCPHQPCPYSRISFKQQQCSSFNSKAFGKRHYVWVPLYPDDYISISSKPCDLQCTTTTGERQLLVPAHDGTYCRDGIYQGVCIEGQCQVVGCDGKLYSSKKVDKCGVCGGTGNSCYRVSGSYRKGITQLGYLFITSIPAGATDIQIIERRKTENILALSDEAGHFFFNGNFIIDNPRNFHVAGTVFKYRRPANIFSDGLEYIISQGPTNQGLNVMYYNLNGKMPHITYEYTVPRMVEPKMATPLVLDSGFLQKHGAAAVLPEAQQSPEWDTNDTMVEVSYGSNEINVSEEYRVRNHTMLQAPYDGVSQLVGSEWELEPLLNLTNLPSIAPFQPITESLPNNVESDLRGTEGQVDFAHLEANLIYRNAGYQNGTHNLPKSLLRSLTRPGPPQQLCANGSTVASPCPGTEDSEIVRNGVSPGNTLLLDVRPVGLDSEPIDGNPSGPSVETGPLQNRTFPQQGSLFKLQQVVPALAHDTESNEFEVGSLDHDISLADMYRWKVSAYAPCSSTCTTGISISYALCVRFDGSEVDESHCDALTRPEPTHEFCTGKECPPRWETSRWSECSRTCGEGHQFRTVRCWRMMAPGFDSTVYDELCRAADLSKPMARKACRSQACGPQWEISAWSECSARCGGVGLQTREVRCSMDTRLCNNSTRPPAERECKGPPCDRRWTVSDWGPCSGPCGKGRMTRYVVCKNSHGSVISDVQCDLDLKPLAVYPCGDRNCPAHWVEQEWEQCNATCGRGSKTRQVVCSGLENGVFKEFPEHACDPALKPEETAACFERPCSKWFTTAWSQCSKTCGSGVKVREVKCYQGEELGHSCDSKIKPEARRVCEEQSCPTEAPEEACQDKATANCALVLKVKLCTHWYYRKACCLSCKNKAQ